jgi:hypothetical protein
MIGDWEFPVPDHDTKQHIRTIHPMRRGTGIMSSEACLGCWQPVHDIDEHLEASVDCRTMYPEVVRRMVSLGIIDKPEVADE